jgi:hypothetical protein
MLKMMSGATDPAGVGNGTPRPTSAWAWALGIEASDLPLVRGDLLAVPDAILLSRRALAIKGNLARASAVTSRL